MRVTLNISSREVRVLATSGNQVLKWGVAPLQPGQVKDGLVQDPAAVGRAIGAVFQSLGLPRAGIWVTMSGLSFTYRLLTLPKMNGTQLREAVMRAARKEMAVPLEELYLSWRVVGTRAEETDVFVMGVPHNPVDELSRTLGHADIRAAGMDIKALALARAAGHAQAVIVDFEPDCFDIVIVAGGLPVTLHSVSPRGEASAAEDDVRHLADELARTVSFHNITHPEHPLPVETPLVLTGSLSEPPAVTEVLQAATGFRIEALTGPLKHPPGFPVARFAANLGLSVKSMGTFLPRGGGTGFRDIDVNMLETRLAAGAWTASLRGKTAPIALVVVVALLTPAFLVRNQAASEVKRLEGQVDVLDRELRLARLRVDEVTRTEEIIAEIEAGMTDLERERQRVLGGLDTGADVQAATDALQPYGTLVSVDSDLEEVVVEVGVGSRDDALAYAAALGALGRFAEVRIARLDAPDADGQVACAIVLTR